MPPKGSNHTSATSTATAIKTRTRNGMSANSSCSASATPPTSAATVMMFTTSEASSVTNPAVKPMRWRTTSNTGRLVTIATRPDISAKTMMPTTPTRTAQTTWKPNKPPPRPRLPGEKEDAEDPDKTPQKQRGAKKGPRLDVEHQLADVDEPADSGDHAQGDLKRLLHSASATSLASLASSSRSRRTRPAS